MSIKKWLDVVKPYLKDFINILKKFGALKIQLTAAINFILLKYIDKECIKHSKSDNKKIMKYYKTDEVGQTIGEILSTTTVINIWQLGQ